LLSKLDAINHIVGLPVETLNSLQKLWEALNNDGDFFNSMMRQINLKSDISYVNNQIDIILHKFLYYDTREQSNYKFLLNYNIFNTHNMSEVDLKFSNLINGAPKVLNTINELAAALNNDSNYATIIQNQISTKQNSVTCYLKSEMDVYLAGLNAGINTRVSKSVVGIDGKFKITTSEENNSLKIQKVICLTPYDALDLSFNTEDKTSILYINNIDILANLASKASTSNVYTKEEIHNNDIFFGNALNNKAGKSTTYNKTETNVSLSILQAAIDKRVLIYTVDINGKFKLKAGDDNNFKIQRTICTSFYDSLGLIFNDTDKTSIVKVNHIDILSVLNSRASSSNVYTKEAIKTLNTTSNNNSNTSSYSKADQVNTYTKTEMNVNLSMLQADVDTRVLIYTVDTHGKFKLKSGDDNNFKIQRTIGT
jgi:hypothetical protein